MTCQRLHVPEIRVRSFSLQLLWDVPEGLAVKQSEASQACPLALRTHPHREGLEASGFTKLRRSSCLRHNMEEAE